MDFARDSDSEIEKAQGPGPLTLSFVPPRCRSGCHAPSRREAQIDDGARETGMRQFSLRGARPAAAAAAVAPRPAPTGLARGNARRDPPPQLSPPPAPVPVLPTATAFPP